MLVAPLERGQDGEVDRIKLEVPMEQGGGQEMTKILLYPARLIAGAWAFVPSQMGLRQESPNGFLPIEL